LSVEASVMSGNGRLILTGQLGEVMQESARAALSHLRSLAATLAIDEQRVAKLDVHVHVPEGAIPKDGPSAGITLAVALCSALTGRAVRQDLAMTGELTLRGSVLPVGGVRHKVLAARRAGLQQVVLPRLNRAEVEAIPSRLLRGLQIHYVDQVTEVLERALLECGPEPAGTTQAPEGKTDEA
jgi:ATP-dependent Lon protease